MGAANAGQTPTQVAAAAVVDGLRRICPRCTRLVERIINGLHCVSCYNRHREAERGRNSKGGRPRIIALFHTENVTVLRDSASAGVVQTFERVTSRVEAMLLAAKRNGGPIAFAPARLPPFLAPIAPR